jgi:hypothetical protein
MQSDFSKPESSRGSPGTCARKPWWFAIAPTVAHVFSWLRPALTLLGTSAGLGLGFACRMCAFHSAALPQRVGRAAVATADLEAEARA